MEVPIAKNVVISIKIMNKETIETKVRPLFDFLLLVQEDDKDEVTESGIYIPSSDDKKQYHGIYARVIAKGPDGKNEKITVGSRVVVNRYDLIPIREGSRQLEILRGEELVVAVCEE